MKAKTKRIPTLVRKSYMIPIYVPRKIKRLFTFHAEKHRNTIKNKAKI